MVILGIVHSRNNRVEIVGSRNGHSRNGRVRNGCSRIGCSRIGTSIIPTSVPDTDLDPSDRKHFGHAECGSLMIYFRSGSFL